MNTKDSYYLLAEFLRTLPISPMLQKVDKSYFLVLKYPQVSIEELKRRNGRIGVPRPPVEVLTLTSMVFGRLDRLSGRKRCSFSSPDCWHYCLGGAKRPPFVRLKLTKTEHTKLVKYGL